ncbi:phospholipase B domain containing lamina ancestor [Oratosquilla oratoria]|uniref:phospholipase B domain containing lamina ancestor n=1 Tax=Oratosquilla oratoria TaxID=337810 RepID=UPI003F772887
MPSLFLLGKSPVGLQGEGCLVPIPVPFFSPLTIQVGILGGSILFPHHREFPHHRKGILREMDKMGTLRLVSVLVSLFLATASGKLFTVTHKEGNYSLHEGNVAGWVARAYFQDNTFVDGWGYLELETNSRYPEEIQAFAAGFVEGATTTDMIYKAYRNTLEGFCDYRGQKFCAKLKKYLKTNMDWMLSQISAKSKSCPVFHNVGLILQQLHGMEVGYNSTAEKEIPADSLLLMNLSGDLEDLEAALMADELSSSADQDHPRAKDEGHCSALIKVLPGNTDLYVSHVTWNSYQAMLRIQKKYILPFRRTGSSDYKDINPGHTVSFSSYPGILHSGDDFYIISSGLVTLETTIGNGNPDLWKNINATGQLQEWIRVIVANRVATDGKSWSNFFSMHNSGTYNNQWMIVDYNKFKMGQNIRNDTLWIVEQLPGYMQSGDQSHVLRKQTYWPSYNVPFYENIFNLSGSPAMVEKYGNWFSYDKTPRALIFLRDHVKVKSIPSMIKLMRYNDYQNDPLSLCNCTPPYSAENAISARSDLNPKNGTYPFGSLGHRSHGGTDMKLTTSGMIKQLSYYAVNGPTYDQQPVFEWSKQDFANDTPHYGQPEVWKFPVVKVKWLW